MSQRYTFYSAGRRQESSFFPIILMILVVAVANLAAVLELLLIQLAIKVMDGIMAARLTKQESMAEFCFYPRGYS